MRVSTVVVVLILIVAPSCSSSRRITRTQRSRPQAHEQEQSGPGAPSSRLIVVAREAQALQNAMLLDLVPQRLPVVVERGRFEGDAGSTNICVHARRSSARQMAASLDRNGMMFCPMATLYVDGVPISDPGSYLASTQVADVESIELLSAAEAMQRYGLSALGAEVLVVVTVGHRPRARR